MYMSEDLSSLYQDVTPKTPPLPPIPVTPPTDTSGSMSLDYGPPLPIGDNGPPMFNSPDVSTSPTNDWGFGGPPMPDLLPSAPPPVEQAPPPPSGVPSWLQGPENFIGGLVKPLGISQDAVNSFGNQFVQSIPGAAGGLVGASSAMEAVAPASAALLASGIGDGPVGPIAAGALELGAGFVGGLIGSGLVGKAQDMIEQGLMGATDYNNWQNTLAQQQKENPVASAIGSFTANGLFFAPNLKMLSTAAEAAGRILAGDMSPLADAAVRDALLGVAMGSTTQAAMEAQQQIQSGNFDPAVLAASAVAGALMNHETKLGRILSESGRLPVRTVQEVLGVKHTAIDQLQEGMKAGEQAQGTETQGTEAQTPEASEAADQTNQVSTPMMHIEGDEVAPEQNYEQDYKEMSPGEISLPENSGLALEDGDIAQHVPQQDVESVRQELERRVEAGELANDPETLRAAASEIGDEYEQLRRQEQASTAVDAHNQFFDQVAHAIDHPESAAMPMLVSKAATATAPRLAPGTTSLLDRIRYQKWADLKRPQTADTDWGHVIHDSSDPFQRPISDFIAGKVPGFIFVDKPFTEVAQELTDKGIPFVPDKNYRFLISRDGIYLTRDRTFDGFTLWKSLSDVPGRVLHDWTYEYTKLSPPPPEGANGTWDEAWRAWSNGLNQYLQDSLDRRTKAVLDTQKLDPMWKKSLISEIAKFVGKNMARPSLWRLKAPKNLAQQVESRGNKLTFRTIRNPQEAVDIAKGQLNGNPQAGFRAAASRDGYKSYLRNPKIEAAESKGAVPVFTTPFPSVARDYYTEGANLTIAIEYHPKGLIYTADVARKNTAKAATFVDSEQVIDARQIKHIWVLTPDQIELIEGGYRPLFEGNTKAKLDADVVRHNIARMRNLLPVQTDLNRPFLDKPIRIQNGLQVQKGSRVRLSTGGTATVNKVFSTHSTPRSGRHFEISNSNGIVGNPVFAYENDIHAVYKDGKWIEAKKPIHNVEPWRSLLNRASNHAVYEALGPDAKVFGNHTAGEVLRTASDKLKQLGSEVAEDPVRKAWEGHIKSLQDRTTGSLLPQVRKLQNQLSERVAGKSKFEWIQQYEKEFERYVNEHDWKLDHHQFPLARRNFMPIFLEKHLTDHHTGDRAVSYYQFLEWEQAVDRLEKRIAELQNLQPEIEYARRRMENPDLTQWEAGPRPGYARYYYVSNNGLKAMAFRAGQFRSSENTGKLFDSLDLARDQAKPGTKIKWIDLKGDTNINILPVRQQARKQAELVPNQSYIKPKSTTAWPSDRDEFRNMAVKPVMDWSNHNRYVLENAYGAKIPSSRPVMLFISVPNDVATELLENGFTQEKRHLLSSAHASFAPEKAVFNNELGATVVNSPDQTRDRQLLAMVVKPSDLRSLHSLEATDPKTAMNDTLSFYGNPEAYTRAGLYFKPNVKKIPANRFLPIDVRELKQFTNPAYYSQSRYHLDEFHQDEIDGFQDHVYEQIKSELEKRNEEHEAGQAGHANEASLNGEGEHASQAGEADEEHYYAVKDREGNTIAAINPEGEVIRLEEVPQGVQLEESSNPLYNSAPPLFAATGPDSLTSPASGHAGYASTGDDATRFAAETHGTTDATTGDAARFTAATSDGTTSGLAGSTTGSGHEGLTSRSTDASSAASATGHGPTTTGGTTNAQPSTSSGHAGGPTSTVIGARLERLQNFWKGANVPISDNVKTTPLEWYREFGVKVHIVPGTMVDDQMARSLGYALAREHRSGLLQASGIEHVFVRDSFHSDPETHDAYAYWHPQTPKTVVLHADKFTDGFLKSSARKLENAYHSAVQDIYDPKDDSLFQDLRAAFGPAAVGTGMARFARAVEFTKNETQAEALSDTLTHELVHALVGKKAGLAPGEHPMLSVYKLARFLPEVDDPTIFKGNRFDYEVLKEFQATVEEFAKNWGVLIESPTVIRRLDNMVMRLANVHKVDFGEASGRLADAYIGMMEAIDYGAGRELGFLEHSFDPTTNETYFSSIFGDNNKQDEYFAQLVTETKQALSSQAATTIASPQQSQATANASGLHTSPHMDDTGRPVWNQEIRELHTTSPLTRATDRGGNTTTTDQERLTADRKETRRVAAIVGHITRRNDLTPAGRATELAKKLGLPHDPESLSKYSGSGAMGLLAPEEQAKYNNLPDSARLMLRGAFGDAVDTVKASEPGDTSPTGLSPAELTDTTPTTANVIHLPVEPAHGVTEHFTLAGLKGETVPQLVRIANGFGVDTTGMRKDNLINAIRDAQSKISWRDQIRNIDAKLNKLTGSMSGAKAQANAGLGGSHPEDIAAGNRAAGMKYGSEIAALKKERAELVERVKATLPVEVQRDTERAAAEAMPDFKHPGEGESDVTDYMPPQSPDEVSKDVMRIDGDYLSHYDKEAAMAAGEEDPSNFMGMAQGDTLASDQIIRLAENIEAQKGPTVSTSGGGGAASPPQPPTTGGAKSGGTGGTGGAKGGGTTGGTPPPPPTKPNSFFSAGWQKSHSAAIASGGNVANTAVYLHGFLARLGSRYGDANVLMHPVRWFKNFYNSIKALQSYGEYLERNINASIDEIAKASGIAKANVNLDILKAIDVLDEAQRQQMLSNLKLTYGDSAAALADLLHEYWKSTGNVLTDPTRRVFTLAVQHYLPHIIVKVPDTWGYSGGKVYMSNGTIAPGTIHAIGRVTDQSTGLPMYRTLEDLKSQGFTVKENLGEILRLHQAAISRASRMREFIHFAQHLTFNGQYIRTVKGQSVFHAAPVMSDENFRTLRARDALSASQMRKVKLGYGQDALDGMWVHKSLADQIERLAQPDEGVGPLGNVARVIKMFNDNFYKPFRFMLNPIHMYNMGSNMITAAYGPLGVLDPRNPARLYLDLIRRGDRIDANPELLADAIEHGVVPPRQLMQGADLGGGLAGLLSRTPGFEQFHHLMWDKMARRGSYGLYEHLTERYAKQYEATQGMKPTGQALDELKRRAAQHANTAVGFQNKLDMTKDYKLYGGAVTLANTWTTLQARTLGKALGITKLGNLGGGETFENNPAMNELDTRYAQRLLFGGLFRLILGATVLSTAVSYLFTGQYNTPLQNFQRDPLHTFDAYQGIDPNTKRETWLHFPFFGFQRELADYTMAGIKAYQQGQNPILAPLARITGKANPLLKTGLEEVMGREIGRWMQGYGDAADIDNDKAIVNIRKSLDGLGIPDFGSVEDRLIYAFRNFGFNYGGFAPTLQNGNANVSQLAGQVFDFNPLGVLGTRQDQGTAYTNQGGTLVPTSQVIAQSQQKTNLETQMVNAAKAGNMQEADRIRQQLGLSVTAASNMILHGVTHTVTPGLVNSNLPQGAANGAGSTTSIAGHALTTVQQSQYQEARFKLQSSTMSFVNSLPEYKNGNASQRTALMNTYITLADKINKENQARALGYAPGKPISEQQAIALMQSTHNVASMITSQIMNSQMYTAAPAEEQQRMLTEYSTAAHNAVYERYSGTGLYKNLSDSAIVNLLNQRIAIEEPTRKFVASLPDFREAGSPYEQNQIMNHYVSFAQKVLDAAAQNKTDSNLGRAIKIDEVMPLVMNSIALESSAKDMLHQSPIYINADVKTQAALDNKYANLARKIAVLDTRSNINIPVGDVSSLYKQGYGAALKSRLMADEAYQGLQNSFGGAQQIDNWSKELSALKTQFNEEHNLPPKQISKYDSLITSYYEQQNPQYAKYLKAKSNWEQYTAVGQLYLNLERDAFTFAAKSPLAALAPSLTDTNYIDAINAISAGADAAGDPSSPNYDSTDDPNSPNYDPYA